MRAFPSEVEPSRSSSRLIADGDSVARNAFRVGLREETPLPISRGNAGVTQELDPGDILEVQDMAEAIARAEMLVARSQTPTPSSSRAVHGDIFESLGRRPTDDTAGPATPAPLGLYTPVPPRFPEPEPTPVPYASAAPAAAPLPTPSTPRYLTMPSAPTALEEDAFYHPIGRGPRSLADVTLDGYRPEPTLLVRAASRRKRFSWVLLAALVPLLALAGVAGFASTELGSSAPSEVAPAPRVPAVRASSKTPFATTSAAAKSASVVTPVTPVTSLTSGAPSTPVFDVNSLPAAGTKR